MNLRHKTVRRCAPLGVVAAAAAAIGGVAVAQTGPAAASQSQSQGTIRCYGAQTARYTPRATAQSRPTKTKLNEVYPSCEGPVRKGRGAAKLRQDVSCAASPNVVTSKPDILRYRFPRNDRRSTRHHRRSVVTFTTTTVTRAAGQTIIVSTGTVTSGYRKGDSATRTVTLSNTDKASQCSSKGLKRQVGNSQLTIS